MIRTLHISRDAMHNGDQEGLMGIADGVVISAPSAIRVAELPDTLWDWPWPINGIGNGAFFGCQYLEAVLIPNTVTSIGKAAFYRCKSLTSVTIPDSVTSIGDEAFFGCTSLRYVSLPSRELVHIGEDAWGAKTSLLTPSSFRTKEHSRLSRQDLWIKGGTGLLPYEHKGIGA